MDFVQLTLWILGSALAILAVAIFALIMPLTRGRAARIRARGCELAARVYGPNRDAPAGAALLCFSGWNPNGFGITTNDLLASRLSRDLGILCVTVSLRGMGSPGDIDSLTRADFLADAEAAFDYVASLPQVDPKRIIIAGESFGSYLGCLLSTRRPARALALRVPTDFPADGFSDRPQKDFAAEKSREWKSRPHGYGESPALEAFHRFSGDILLVSAGRDEIVPAQTTKNYLAAAADGARLERREMPRAGHALICPKAYVEYRRILTEWIRRIL